MAPGSDEILWLYKLPSGSNAGQQRPSIATEVTARGTNTWTLNLTVFLEPGDVLLNPPLVQLTGITGSYNEVSGQALKTQS